MNTFKIAAKVATIAALLSTSAAFAGDPATQTPAATPAATTLPDFRTLDANADGVVSKDEAKTSADLTANWAAYDADKNGSLSSAEYMKAKEGMKKDGSKQY